MAITFRNCIVCDSPMECRRANKLICSNVCHSRMHKQRVKLGLTTEEMIQQLQKQKEPSPNE